MVIAVVGAVVLQFAKRAPRRLLGAPLGVDVRSHRAGRAAPSIMDAAPSIMDAAYDAAAEGDLRGVEVALAAGADVNQKHEDMGGDTMLIVAAENGHHEVVRLLLEHGADPDLGDDNMYRPLHVADDAKTIDLLVAHGANLEIRNEDNTTPLMYGLPLKCVDSVGALLRHGASFNTRDSNDRTALVLARQLSQITAIRHNSARHKRLLAVIDLLTAVEAAGSWKRYAREPIVRLLSLRFLCLAGRATAPPKLVRCFGAPPVPNAGKARTRARRAASGTPLPNEVFAHILDFWNWRA